MIRDQNLWSFFMGKNTHKFSTLWITFKTKNKIVKTCLLSLPYLYIRSLVVVKCIVTLFKSLVCLISLGYNKSLSIYT